MTSRALLLPLLWGAAGTCARAQQPFYTDDPGVTKTWNWHIEIFNEFDMLQTALRPDRWQNTFNYKLNLGLPHNLEVDVDNDYLGLFRSAEAVQRRAFGIGDTNLGIKWGARAETSGSRLPALAVSMYFEFPTGDEKQNLGSGLIDYWLNGIAQKSLTPKTRLTANLGLLFAGNTSTGLLGIQTTRGRVYTGGLSLIHEVSSKLVVGTEVYGGLTYNLDLGKSQLQFLAGGKYEIVSGLTIDFALLGGKYIGSPRAGVQIGFSWDIPGPAGPGGSKAAAPPVPFR